MSREIKIMKYIESMLIKHNDMLGEAHIKSDFREFQDRQLEVDLLHKLYDELNEKFFDDKL